MVGGHRRRRRCAPRRCWRFRRSVVTCASQAFVCVAFISRSLAIRQMQIAGVGSCRIRRMISLAHPLTSYRFSGCHLIALLPSIGIVVVYPLV